MAITRRIMVSIPEDLLQELDGLVYSNGLNRSQCICQIMEEYIQERKRINLREQMKRGYQEMAEINLALAQEHYYGEQVLEKYEAKLVE